MTKIRLQLFVVAVVTAMVAPQGAGAAVRTPAPGSVMHDLEAAAGGPVEVNVSPVTGRYDMVRAPRGAVLQRRIDRDPEAEARGFLARSGSLLGIAPGDVPSLALRSAEVDATTDLTTVRFEQVHDGLLVVGPQIVVQLSARGVTAVSGIFVPKVSLREPELDAAEAGRIAVRHVKAANDEAEDAVVAETAEQVWVDGLLDRMIRGTRRTFRVDVEAGPVAEQVWVDAATGAIVETITMRHAAKDRCVYTPAYVNPTGQDELAVRREGSAPSHVPPIDNLYDYSGQVYDLFADVFGRDSWDGKGQRMRTVYDLTAICPNAYWEPGRGIARFCPGFDTDDIVAHEWGHAYTQETHGLIYLNQPGALNESYSDIWGEVIDLTNGVDGIGGDNNDDPAPQGQRWLVGEDLREVGEAIGLRDMWDPERRNMAGKVSSPRYTCGSGDNGGVHSNSSVPNHAFAMLVDGKTYNGHDVGAIGMTKAAHIYYRAMVAYQTPTSGFAEHADALRAACADLLGITLAPIPGDAAGQAVSAADCGEVEDAIAATEMDDPPAQCGGPLLAPDAPDPCPGGTTLLSEDWETGTDGWTTESVGTAPSRWIDANFVTSDDLPQDRAGTAIFAENSHVRGCSSSAAKNPAGRFSVTSPPVTAPSGQLTLRFDHAVATEATYDGGNVMVSVNDGAFVTVPQAAYVHNAPNATLRAGNPKAAQHAWSGTDTGVLTGSWGTSVADLSSVVEEGDTFSVRFEFGQDCEDGRAGWWIDDIAILSCPPRPAPLLKLGEGYTEPDDDGAYELTWDRDEQATGPDLLQEAAVLTSFTDDASSGLDAWTSSTEGAGAFDWTTAAKPRSDGLSFHAPGNEATTGTSSILTSRAKVAIPAAGITTLHFEEWAYNHAGDKTVVEVSTDGTTWKQVYARNSTYELAAEARYAADALNERSVNLTPFAGEELFLRFRFTQGPELYIDVTRFGWYVDDIAVTNHSWSDLATVSGTSYNVSGRSPGRYMYRVKTLYGTLSSDHSNVVAAIVG